MTTTVNRAEAGERAAQERMARLEHDLGDLDDPGNPLGADHFLAADRRQLLLPAAERLLDGFGLNAEFVPSALGGRLDRLDVLARVLRAVFRRDAALGLGYGMTSYLAAVLVWADGTPDQQAQTAELLLNGGRMAGAYPEPTPGNDFLHNRLTASRVPGGHRLDGRKEALNNAARVDSLVVFAHTPEAGPDAQTAFLLPGPAQHGDGLALSPRRRTSGIRGCAVHGLEFSGRHVDSGRLLGPEGGGTLLADRAFPVTRSTGPSMALGCADTALRTTVAFARAHRARSRASLRSARTRSALVDAFTDLLICDCLALVATRGVHLLPRESGILSAVVKYLLPTFLTEMVYDLSVVLGSESYATAGSYGMFQKTARDLPMIGLGSAGTVASRSAVVEHLLRLPTLTGAPDGPDGPDGTAALFRPHHDDLPPVRPDELTRPARRDTLLDSLTTTVASARSARGEFGGALGEAADALARELRLLHEDGERLAARPPGTALSPRVYALADRYALIVAGAACLGVWHHAAGDPDAGLLADPAWAAMALARVVGRLDRTAVHPPEEGTDHLLSEVLDRFDDARSFDLYATQLGR
ncbi:acyl-CoA dehydrogenase [Streptomyces sp. SID5785]|uniref:acyl-CoA dehydrogenase n=1 Tax=Streptomyces sp. SID5785 TaxID=2690309 RepID=UPI00136189B0|nr:acyl-CoA dehydrogenase [Streptomyces sp. SID5785]MZD07802.1 acyl-CoA dehydrogenase [Streptomyces sp. SID5785]